LRYGTTEIITPLEVQMAKVLVYYPFKLNAWYGKSVTFTLNKQKHDIDFCSENLAPFEKTLAFQKVAFDRDNKVYIVGHSGSGEDNLYSEPSKSGNEESIHYTDLARKISDYTRQDATVVGAAMHAKLKILACQSGARSFDFGKAVCDFFGRPVPTAFLSFAQKLWNELYHKYGFRCVCHAYTKGVLWNINKQGVGDVVTGVKVPKDLNPAGNRFFYDEDGDLQRAQGCRIVVVAT
jgi:hypothetical protein